MRAALPLLLLLLCARAARGEEGWLDRLDDSLFVELAGGSVRSDLSGLLDLEGYLVDQRPPGLLFGSGGDFVNPRLSLFLDTHLGRRLYSLVQARIDRGFDPRAESFDARFDEYLLRYAPFDGPEMSLQVGKFATVVGNWVLRHDSWSNPLVNAPFPYENVTTVTDAKAPASPEEFLGRSRLADKKRDWLPVVWGPSYATGASIFGSIRAIEYGLEVKNAPPSSRPAIWDGRERGFGDPTLSGRVGIRPDPAWGVGASLSAGSYLRDPAGATLPAGRDIGDFEQRLAGFDAAFAWRHVELWSELFLSQFEVPNVGDANTAVYYVESRLRIASRLSAALRWNQQLFGEVDDSAGRRRDWDRDAWRIDSGLAWRFDRHVQAKIQYGYGRQQGRLQQGEQLGAAQLTVRF